VDLIGHFLAVLELMRARIVQAIQEQAFGEIVIEALVAELPERWQPDQELWSAKAPAIDEKPLPVNGGAPRAKEPPEEEPHESDPDAADEFTPLPDVRLDEREPGRESSAGGEAGG
jgi:hypothetical protein